MNEDEIFIIRDLDRTIHLEKLVFKIFLKCKPQSPLRED